MKKLTPLEKNQKIEKEIICETRRLFERAGFTVPRIARELAIIGFSDPADIAEITEGGELQFKTFKNMGKKRRAIKKVKEKTVITESKDGNELYKTSTVEYEMHDKLDALGKAIAVIGIQKPIKHDVNVKGDLRINVIDKFEGK